MALAQDLFSLPRQYETDRGRTGEDALRRTLPPLTIGAVYAALVIISIALDRGLSEQSIVWFASPILMLPLTDRRKAVSGPALIAAMTFATIAQLLWFGTAITLWSARIIVDASTVALVVRLMPQTAAWRSVMGLSERLQALLIAGATPALIHAGLTFWLSYAAGTGGGGTALQTLMATLIGSSIAAQAMWPSTASDMVLARRRSLIENIGLVVLSLSIPVMMAFDWALPALISASGLMIWLAFRFSRQETAIVGGIVATIILSGAINSSGSGILPGLPTEDRFLISQSFLLFILWATFGIGEMADRLRSLGARLTQIEKEMRGLSAALNDSVTELDPGGAIRHYHPGSENIFGKLSGPLVGLRFSNLLPVSSREAFAYALADLLSGSERVTFTFVRGPVEECCHYRAELTATKDDQAEITCIFVAMRNISREQRALRELRKRSEMLARTNAELEQFAYVASHDLQEPLRTVASFCELIQRRYASKLDDDGREFIQFTIDGSKRLQSLIRDLLALSRVTTRGKAFRVVPMESLLDRALRRLQSEIERSGTRIIVGPLPDIVCDPDQMEEVFFQIIDNSLKYRSQKTPTIEIDCEETEEDWSVSITDNGVGFDPTFKERIFLIFQRLQTRDAYPGNGIGLAVVRKILDRHGGRVWAQPLSGGGSEVSFLLPRTPPVTDLEDETLMETGHDAFSD
jgi:signal transduction histidine kinase